MKPIINRNWSTLVLTFLLAGCAASDGRTGDPAGLIADHAEKNDASPQAKAVDSPSATPTTEPPPVVQISPSESSASQIETRGAQLYAKYCAICHGEKGDGTGKFAYLMNPRPRNFQQGDFKLTTTVNQVPTDDDLLRVLSRGMPGSAMPPWGHLPNSDLMALVRQVRQFHVAAVRAKFEADVKSGRMTPQELEAAVAERTVPAAPLPIIPEPVMDDLRWFRGRRLYVEACASCHGMDGHPVAEAVKFDAEGYPVPPRSFVNGIFKGGMEGHQLYCRVAKGMRGTPMPGYDSAFRPDEIWDMVHYVQSLARTGAQERAQLRQGTLVASNTYGSLPTGPTDVAWEQARPLYVALTPLWWEEKRIEGVVMQALHNEKELAIRLTWLDDTRDDRAVRHDEFRDAVALQFSLSSDPPFYMGSPGQHGGVNIWMWKADRQTNIQREYLDVDAVFTNRAVDYYPEPAFKTPDSWTVDRPNSALITRHNSLFLTAWGAGNLVADPTLKTPVECLVARGPGTLAGKAVEAQMVQGQAIFDRGVWMVQMQRSMVLPDGHGEQDERLFRRGDYIPVSVAIWNGAVGDRDGKKNISIWQKLVID